MHKSDFGYPPKQFGPSAVPPALYGRERKPWVKPAVRRIEPPADTDFSPENEG